MIDQKLTTLIAVNKFKNFSKAANHLGLTQPAVSTHIKLLEEEYKIKIFNKNEKELILTNEGLVLLKYAKRIDSLYNLISEAIENEKKHIKSLTIGMTHTAENSDIPKVLAAYTLEKEDVKEVKNIKIISDDIKNIYNKLKTYEIDLAIVEGRFPDKDFNTVLLDTDSLVLIVANDNPLSKKKIVSINELKKEKLILRLPNSDSRIRFEAALKNFNIDINDFNITLELDSISVIKNLVSDNYGVSIIAKSSCLEDIKKGYFKMINVENLSMVREINLIYHQDFEHLDFINELIELYNSYNN